MPIFTVHLDVHSDDEPDKIDVEAETPDQARQIVVDGRRGIRIRKVKLRRSTD